MSPLSALYAATTTGVPRASGDEPYGSIPVKVKAECSPRERG